MGKLYGIGVGPGDPELLTLKAYKILNQADVIFCPEIILLLMPANRILSSMIW